MPEGGEFKSKAELIDKKNKTSVNSENFLQPVIICQKIITNVTFYLCSFYNIYFTHYCLIESKV